jgi:hypothetical protein
MKNPLLQLAIDFVDDPKFAFKTPYNSGLFPLDHEINDLPSLTIPDQAISVPEMLLRNSRGLPLGGQKVPLYESDDNSIIDEYNDGIDPRKLDLSERMDKIKNASDELADLSFQESARKLTKKEKAIQQSLLDEIETEKNDPLTDDKKS